MPCGTSRFTMPVVSMASIMPLIGASGQEPAAAPTFDVLIISEAPEGFVIRASGRKRQPLGSMPIGSSVKMDRALLAGPRALSPSAPQGDSDEPR
jgi:hypothetical protein